MNVERLLTNMQDQVLEAQIKLGYAKETIRLYYPVSSLNALLGLTCTGADTMLAMLEQEEALKYTRLGRLQFAVHSGRLEIGIPPEGVEWVYRNLEPPAFLKRFIGLFQEKHSCTIEEVCQVFAEFSHEYVCDVMPFGIDFDYCVHFLDRDIDEYYYCIKMEMGHTIYHRFMQEDYEQLFY